jgi:hypothetical protein
MAKHGYGRKRGGEKYHGIEDMHLEDIGHYLNNTHAHQSKYAREQAIQKGKDIADKLRFQGYLVVDPRSSGYGRTKKGRKKGGDRHSDNNAIAAGIPARFARDQAIRAERSKHTPALGHIRTSSSRPDLGPSLMSSSFRSPQSSTRGPLGRLIHSVKNNHESTWKSLPKFLRNFAKGITNRGYGRRRRQRK